MPRENIDRAAPARTGSRIDPPSYGLGVMPERMRPDMAGAAHLPEEAL